MGLWTVTRIVNKHRGDVKIQSARGEGTRIDLWWPRVYKSTVEREKRRRRKPYLNWLKKSTR
jgi:hypothetical protein